MTEGISYFCLQTLFSFSFVPPMDVRQAVNYWTQTVVSVSDKMINQQYQLQQIIKDKAEIKVPEGTMQSRVSSNSLDNHLA